MARICSAGVEPFAFSQGLTMIVLIGLPFGTVSSNCADCGAAAEDEPDELELRAVPIVGSGDPCRGTNSAEGRLVVPVDPP